MPAATALAVVLLRVLAIRTVCLFSCALFKLGSLDLVKSIISAEKGFSGRQGRGRRNTVVLQGRGY